MARPPNRLWWRRGNNCATTNGKQQSTNVQHAHGRLAMVVGWGEGQRGDGSWRDAVDRATDKQLRLVAEGQQRRWQQWQKKQQSTNEWRQRWKMVMAGERWGAVVEAEERLLCRGKCFSIRSWRMEVEDGRGCSFFLFLAGLNLTSNPTSMNHKINKAWFLGFWGVFMLGFEEGMGFLGLGVFLWSFLVILPPILPRILPQSYQQVVESMGLSTWHYIFPILHGSYNRQ